ncbi:hypothetical protein [Actinomadura rayongensis]|uniref:Uncharacterized protein n=1 Tax=Actinomadura rayongensis TaxID=1429076 RepID=A0A6I4W547_9ACTN|nr:hypothetical protein [Actinomadura rayongensis]MXQ64581.1 hypothetical protein [Actinomadura rayongensis]
MCAAVANLPQSASEIYFDMDRYVEAAHCDTLAADAACEADSYDSWPCALVRHAHVDMYEKRFDKAVRYWIRQGT